MKGLLFVATLVAGAVAFATDTIEDGVRTLKDTTVSITSEAELGAGVTNVVLDNATLNFNLSSNVTLALTYVAKNGGKLGIGPAGRTATIASTRFLKPSLGNTFGKTGAGQLNIGTALSVVSTPTTFEVFEGTVRLTSGDFFGGHSATTTNFAIKVHEGATWHNGTAHGAVGPVELTGATWISDNPSPYSGFWSETSFKGGIVVHPSATPSKIYSTSWDFLTQPSTTQCVIDVEEGADLYVYADLKDGSGQKSVLVKRGDGALHLMGVGSWTGGTRIEAGKIVLGNAKALGSSVVTVMDGIELAVNPGITVTCPELQGSGTITVSGKGGISFPKKADTITGATNHTAESYEPFADGVLTVQAGVNEINVPSGSVTLTDVIEYDSGCASLADIRKTGAGTLVLGTGLSGKYRKLIAVGGDVEFAGDTGFGMSGIDNKGGVEISGGKIRPTADYTMGATRFTFVGSGTIDVPQGVDFQSTSNCLYCADATVTKTGLGRWFLKNCYQHTVAKVVGTRWVIEQGKMAINGGSDPFGGWSTIWKGTIEIHEDGTFEQIGCSTHLPLGPIVLRGGTLRAPRSQFQSGAYKPQGAAQWKGFAFNGGVTVLASERPAQIIARACHLGHVKFTPTFDVQDGATLVVDTALYPGQGPSSTTTEKAGDLVKTGGGTLKLLKPLSLSGRFDIEAGTVELADGGIIDEKAHVRVAKAAKLLLNDGTRFTASADVANGILREADVWIDATQISAQNGAELTTIANLGRSGGKFGKFTKAISNSGGMIPKAPTYLAKGIGGKPSFNFDGQMALALDSYTNNTDNCEIFVVATWTTYGYSDGTGRWTGAVSLGSTKMTGNEDQHNFGVLSTMVDGGSAGKFGSMSVIFGTPEGNETSGANHATASLSSTLLSPGVSTNEAFVLRIQRGSTAGNSDIWLGDARGTKKNSSTYTERRCRIDRVCIGSRLMTGGLATTYNTLAKSRNIIGQVGEFLVFTRKLSATERSAVSDYLRRKWIGTSAAADPSAATTLNSALEVSVPDGAKAAFAPSLGVDAQQLLTVTKKGAGEIRWGTGNPDADVALEVSAGALRLKDGVLPSRAAVWLDPADAATCLCDADGRVTNLVNKGYCGGSFGKTVASSAGKTPGVPMRSETGINGRATLTFAGEQALVSACYTNKSSPRTISIYMVGRRNRWETNPADATQQAGLGKWATPFSMGTVNSGADDEHMPGALFVSENAQNSSTLDLGSVNSSAFTPAPNGAPSIMTVHSTTNGYFVSVEKGDANTNSVSRTVNDATLNMEPLSIDFIQLGGRLQSKARPQYHGPVGTSANRMWFGDLAEMIVVTHPLTVNEEIDLYEYLRKKWFNKGGGSATPPTWLSGTAATPQFGERTTLAMADGTNLRHEAREVTLGALETAGTVDWVRVWDGDNAAAFSLFDVSGDVSLGNVNLLADPVVRKAGVKVLGYGGSTLTTPTWQVFRPDGKLRQGSSVTDRDNGYWLWGQVGSLFLVR